MPEITKDQALAMMEQEIRRFDAAELVEVYNAVFHRDRYTGEGLPKDTRPLVDRLIAHIHSDLEMDVFTDLFNLILIKYVNVWYNEEEDRIHYDEWTEASVE